MTTHKPPSPCDLDPATLAILERVARVKELERWQQRRTQQRVASAAKTPGVPGRESRDT
jgi:hypothetical protein